MKKKLNNNEDGVNSNKRAWKGLFSQAQKKRTDKNYVEAIDLCNQILANHSKKLSNSGKASVYYERGRSNLAREDYPKAFGDFNSAILLNPDSSDIANYYNSRGVARGKIDTLDNTLQDYNCAINLDAKNSVIYTNRAKVHYEKKDYTLALADYVRAQQLDPKNQNISNWVKKLIDEISTQCSVLLIAIDGEGQKNKQQTLASYDQVFQWMQHDIFANDRVEVFYMRAVFYYNIGEKQNALKDCELAIELAVKFGLEDARFFSLKGLVVGGEASIIFHKKAIDLDPKNNTYHFILAQVYMNLSRYQLAVDSFSMAIKFDPENSTYYSERSRAFSAMGENTKALEDSTEAIKYAPTKAALYSARADLYMSINFYPEVRADLARAILLEDKNSTFYNSLGNLFVDKGESLLAFIYFSKTIDLVEKNKVITDPNLSVNDAWYFKCHGFIALYFGDYKKALDFYNKAIELNPNQAAYHFQRGVILFNLAEFKDAISDFDKALQLESNKELKKYKERTEDFKKRAETSMQMGLAFQSNENKSFGYEGIQAKLATPPEEKILSELKEAKNKIKELEDKQAELIARYENEKENTAKKMIEMQKQIAKLFSLIPAIEENKDPQSISSFQ